MKKPIKIFTSVICLILLCSCAGDGENPKELSSASPSPFVSPSPEVSPSALPSALPSKVPNEENISSVSGIYGGKADAHSVEIELSDGSIESFYVSDEMFEKIKKAGIEEGGKINFKYTETNGQKTISSIN